MVVWWPAQDQGEATFWHRRATNKLQVVFNCAVWEHSPAVRVIPHDAPQGVLKHNVFFRGAWPDDFWLKVKPGLAQAPRENVVPRVIHKELLSNRSGANRHPSRRIKQRRLCIKSLSAVLFPGQDCVNRVHHAAPVVDWLGASLTAFMSTAAGHFHGRRVASLGV